MPIALVGTPTTVEGTSTTTVTNNVPTGVNNGHLLLWFIGQTGSTTILSPPAGWTLRQSGSTTVRWQSLWYRIASSEPASYASGTFGAAGRTVGIMSAYSGVDIVNPFDVTVLAMSAGTTTIPFPAITPTTAGAIIVAFAGGNVGSGVTTTTLSSSNTTIDGQKTSTQGAATNNVQATSEAAWTSGAFTPAFTASQTLVRTLGHSESLRPAPRFQHMSRYR